MQQLYHDTNQFYQSIPKTTKATIRVKTTLNVCAPMKAKVAFLFSVFQSWRKLVSKPIDTKPKVNHSVWKALSDLASGLYSSPAKKSENTSEASTNPSTNFGKRSQSRLALGFLTSRP